MLIASYIGANSQSQSITISRKNSDDPLNVCNESTYSYKADIEGWQNGYKVTWSQTNGDILSQNTTEAEVKWKADSDNDGNIGTLKAIIEDSGGNEVCSSNVITITIKSIKHLKPEITPYTPGGGTLIISPCESGQKYFEATQLEVPGTGDLNPETVFNYEWVIPSGWSLNGQKSDGSPILADSYISVTYPADDKGGTIKVRGVHVVSGCSAEAQKSKYSDAITVKRDIDWKLTADKDYFLCGDTDPITFTYTPTPEVPCAVYYWNNSTTGTTSNTFEITPGQSDLIVSVKAVYGNTETPKTLIIPVKSFDEIPDISGPEVICEEEEFSVPGLRPGYTLQWDCSRNLSVKSASDNSAIIEAVGTGYGYVKATVYTPCGGEVDLNSVNVAVGPETPGSITVIDPKTNAIVHDLVTHKTYWFRIGFYPSTDPADYNWEVQREEEDGTIIKYLIPPGPTNHLEFAAGYPYPVKYTISAAYNNGCGWGNEISKDFYFFGGGLLSVDLSPNPTSGEVTISIEEDLLNTNTLQSSSENSTFDENTEWDLEVYSESQLLKTRKTSLRGKSTRLQTAGWKEGVYLIRVRYKNEVLIGKLIVKR